MYCLNHRVGILFRENQQKKSYEMRYFFIDDDANLFLLANLPKLQKAIRICSNFKQLKSKLQGKQKSINLHKYQLSNVKQYYSQAVLPFSNRTFIELREKQGKEDKNYLIFGLVDEDTPLISQQILKLTGKVKNHSKSQKKISIIYEQKMKEEKLMEIFFERFLENQKKFKMDRLGEVGYQDLQYEGQLLQNQIEAQLPKAHGKGKQILISQGITYSGLFKNGKKNGPGYLVNSNLDTIYCDFIDDQIAGI